MTGTGQLLSSVAATEERGDRHRYRRAGRWLLAAVTACAVIAVVSDFPLRASAGDKRADLKSYLSTVKGDVGQCNAGLHDAVTAYHDQLVGKLSHAIATTYTEQAIAACSFTNSGVVDLGGVEPPRSLTSLHLDSFAPSVDAWAYLDAFTVLQDLKDVERAPGSAAAVAAYDHEVRLLDRRRKAITGLADRAEGEVGLTGSPFGLVQAPILRP